MKKEENVKRLSIIYIYIITIALCLLILSLVMDLKSANWHVPFAYNGDAIFSGVVVKQIMDNGWMLINKLTGAPFYSNMYDFPITDTIHLLIIKGISIFFKDYAIVLNIFFVLGFIITAVVCLYVLLKFNLGKMISITGSLLFTFMPYHFMRGIPHLFLSSYYIIPLTGMMILWICSGKIDFIKYEKEKKKYIFNANKKDVVFCVLICIMTALSGIYYAFFACFLLFVAGIYSSCNFKKVSNVVTAIFLILIISITIIVNLSPNLIYQYENGKNPGSAARSPVESEVYGLKITQLLLPTSGYRIKKISDYKDKYNSIEPLVNENNSASLGIIGSIGFIMTLFMFLYGKSRKIEMLNHLSILNLSSIFLATIGGFGSIFAITISPQIRAYNRISIYIAFFSIFAFCLIADKLGKKLKKFYKGKYIFGLILLIVLCIGIFDQTNKTFIPPYKELSAEFMNDDQFVKQIESSVPKDAMIFQLPYVPFPESPPVQKMSDYELFKGYLHSNTLRWSYGSMKGREGDLWQKQIVEKPISKSIETIALAGFDGIYIDRNGFTDKDSNEMEKNIFSILKVEPIVSQNKRLVFFSTVDYNKKLKEGYSDQQLKVMEDNVLHPIAFSWQGGFSTEEVDSNNKWRWCSNQGQLTINNSSNKQREISIQMEISTGYDTLSEFKIDSTLLQCSMQINSKGSQISKIIVVPPGKHIINFKSNAKQIIAPIDPRNLVFRVVNFKYSEVK